MRRAGTSGGAPIGRAGCANGSVEQLPMLGYGTARTHSLDMSNESHVAFVDVECHGSLSLPQVPPWWDSRCGRTMPSESHRSKVIFTLSCGDGVVSTRAPIAATFIADGLANVPNDRVHCSHCQRHQPMTVRCADTARCSIYSTRRLRHS